MQWIKHLTDMIDDPKIRRLIRKHGALGYAVYNIAIERIGKRLSTASPLPDLEETAEDIADLLQSDTVKVEEVMLTAMQIGLFEQDEVTGRMVCAKIYKFVDSAQTRSVEIKRMVNAYKGRLSQTVTDCLAQNRLEENRLEENKEGDEATASVSSNTEIDAIIDYLNTKAGRHYRHTEPNRKGIRARIAEGYTSADCRRVIDTKVAEWQGTDMEKHLNCETLFRPSKFDKYLNQAKPTTDDKYERLDNGVMVYKGLI